MNFYKFFVIFVYIFCSNIALSNYVIETSSGITEGYKKQRVINWDDIPYAQPPVGELRWKAPRAINNSKGKITSKKNNFCVQRPSSLGGAEGDGMYVGSEDCLYLDISAPVKNKGNLLPVMFWIHGGGNTSGLKDLYNFNKMVRRHNVIVVRINYRLGPFGWFSHPSIQEFQSGLDKSSNFGTLDIIAALSWVQKNIELFGGDPKNVTIFGESAGGHNVFSLLVSDKSKGLFHKAISMSGYTTSLNPSDAYKQKEKSSTSAYTSSEIVKKIVKTKNYSKDPYSNKDVRSILYDLSTEEFFQHYFERKSYEEIPLLIKD